jgi:hypothetical protein
MPGVHLLQDKAEKDQKVAELEGRAHDVQMLKFGQVMLDKNRSCYSDINI